ncbi:ubiquitin family protein [Ceratobasidium sp. AG-Ba]|nr:ubiquitin family protein [Ceratobasidium sp. AG-Ba]QRW10436.1 ubiquitin family protein [Ceratobasidium sp. AG-Ba]
MSCQTPLDPSGTLPFFAAQHEKRTIAIRRNSNYDATIDYIKKVFPALTGTPASRITISAVFQECGDLLVEINRDLWPDIVSRLSVVHISVDEEQAPELVSAPRKLTEELNNLVISRPIDIEIQVGSKTYPLTLPDNATVRHLKNIIETQVPLQTNRLISSTPGFSFLDDDKTLQDYGVKAGFLITIIANIRIHVANPRRRVSVMGTLYANVSSLRLTVSSRADIPYPNCVLSCGGELLDDSRRLDSYPQITAECEVEATQDDSAVIFFHWFSLVDMSHAYVDDYDLKPLIIRVQPEWDQDDNEEFAVYPESTVLDLKVLQYNVNHISPDRQILIFKGRELSNETDLQGAGVQSGDKIMMKMFTESL